MATAPWVKNARWRSTIAWATRFLQLRRQAAAGPAPVALEDLGIGVVDAQAGHHVGVQHGLPAGAATPDHHVGHHVGGRVCGEAAAGARIEAADQRLGVAQQVVVAAQHALEPREVVHREQLQMMLGDRGRAAQHRLRRVAPGLERGELQGQALRDRAGRDADGVEALQQLQRAGQLLGLDVELGRQGLQHLLQAQAQVAVAVEFLDQHGDQRPVASRAAGAGELADQVLAKGHATGRHLRVLAVVVVALAAAARTVTAPILPMIVEPARFVARHAAIGPLGRGVGPVGGRRLGAGGRGRLAGCITVE
jgi:hypothetical protein